MNVHSVEHLLTFNARHFKRFSGIMIHDPAKEITL